MSTRQFNSVDLRIKLITLITIAHVLSCKTSFMLLHDHEGPSLSLSLLSVALSVKVLTFQAVGEGSIPCLAIEQVTLATLNMFEMDCTIL